MSLKQLTAREVLEAYPSARSKPYGLRVHRGGLACTFKGGWLHATPNEDGSWQATGYVGQFGDRRGRVLLDGPVHPEQQIQRYLDRTGNSLDSLTTEDVAGEIVGAISHAGWVFRTQIDHLPLLDRFPDLELTQAGGSCPFQAEGTLFGIDLYFRYRSGYATLRVGGDLYKPLYVSGMEYGEDLQGWLDDEEFHSLMGQLIPALERAAIYWEFPGMETFKPTALSTSGNWTVNTEQRRPAKFGARAHSAAEAWAEMHEPSEYLRAHGYTDEKQAQMVADREMVNATLTVDDRVFPDPEPDFAHCAVDPVTGLPEKVRP